jgi:serine protease
VPPDIYLRDAVGDTGATPSVGALSLSPDVIVVPNTVPTPAVFGEGSGTENNATLGAEVEDGQDNYIYVRMKNRGVGDATASTATVYWSEPATLITPGMWNLIGTSAPLTVPQGDTLAVTDPITWAEADIPGLGHYCFIATATQAQDPAPALPGPTSWAGFEAFIRNNNNVTWRNFDVINVIPNAQAPPSEAKFMVTGAPDRARDFTLVLMKQVPKGVRVWLDLPLELYPPFKRAKVGKAKVNERTQRVRIELGPQPLVRVPRVRLPKNAHHRCAFYVRGAKGLEHGLHIVAIGQRFKDLEVGRVTFGIRAAREDKKPRV